MGQFDIQFSSVQGFYPNGFHLSRKLYTREEAAKIFAQELILKEDEVLASKIKEKFVRWQTTPVDLREDGLPDITWIVCDKGSRNAQPTWEYDPTEED